MTTELGDVRSNRVGLSKLTEVTSGGGDEVGVAVHGGDLRREEREIFHPGGKSVHDEIRLNPRECRASKEGGRVFDLDRVGRISGRLKVKDKAELGEEVTQLRCALAVEGFGSIDPGLGGRSRRLRRGAR